MELTWLILSGLTEGLWVHRGGGQWPCTDKVH